MLAGGVGNGGSNLTEEVKKGALKKQSKIGVLNLSEFPLKEQYEGGISLPNKKKVRIMDSSQEMIPQDNKNKIASSPSDKSLMKKPKDQSR